MQTTLLNNNDYATVPILPLQSYWTSGILGRIRHKKSKNSYACKSHNFLPVGNCVEEVVTTSRRKEQEERNNEDVETYSITRRVDYGDYLAPTSI